MSVAEVVVAVATGLFAGGMAGMLGVGGGVVMVPAMVVLLGSPQHVAQGTSLMAIVPTALAGTVANARTGTLDRATALRLALGGLAGGAIGSLLALRVFDETSLRRAFGVFVIAVSLRLLFSQPAAKRGCVPGAAGDESARDERARERDEDIAHHPRNDEGAGDERARDGGG